MFTIYLCIDVVFAPGRVKNDMIFYRYFAYKIF